MSRSTLDIVIANKEGREVSKEELSHALEVMSNISHFYSRSLDALIETAEKCHSLPGLMKMRIEMEKGIRERMFQAAKKPPVEWLQPHNLPGSPELLKRMETGKRIFKAATGTDL